MKCCLVPSTSCDRQNLQLLLPKHYEEMCDQGFVGAARFCAKWGIKLVQATLIPLARSYFPLNCEQADQQIFGSSVKSGLIIGHRNTSLLMSIS